MVISLNELLEEVISMKDFRAADFSVESIVDIVSIEEHFHFLFREVLVNVLEAHLIVSTIRQFDETSGSGVFSGVSEENEVPLVLQVVLSDWDDLLDQLGSTRDLGVGLEGVVGGIVIAKVENLYLLVLAILSSAVRPDNLNKRLYLWSASLGTKLLNLVHEPRPISEPVVYLFATE